MGLASQSNSAAEDERPKAGLGALSTTQWLAEAGIVVSLIGLYYQREELKARWAAFKKMNTPAPQLPPEGGKGAPEQMFQEQMPHIPRLGAGARNQKEVSVTWIKYVLSVCDPSYIAHQS